MTLPRVHDLVETRLRPRIQAHGGDVSVTVDKAGHAQVSFHGACRGCPALAMTYYAAVRSLLLSSGAAADVSCAQVNVSPHAHKRLEALWWTPREDISQ